MSETATTLQQIHSLLTPLFGCQIIETIIKKKKKCMWGFFFSLNSIKKTLIDLNIEFQ